MTPRENKLPKRPPVKVPQGPLALQEALAKVGGNGHEFALRQGLDGAPNRHLSAQGRFTPIWRRAPTVSTLGHEAAAHAHLAELALTVRIIAGLLVERGVDARRP